MATSGTSTPKLAQHSRAAVSWPCPPSIRTRSGQGESASSWLVSVVRRHLQSLRGLILRRHSLASRHSARVSSRGASASSRLKRRSSTSRIMAKSSPGVSVGRADVEFAVLAFAESLRGRRRSWRRPRSSLGYGCCRRPRCGAARAADRNVSASWRKQLLLRRGFGKLAPERLARIGERMLDQILLLAALRHRDFDLVAGLGRERFGQQRAVLDVMRDQDQPRRRLVVVELRRETPRGFRPARASGRLWENRRGCPSSARCGRRTPRRR